MTINKFAILVLILPLVCHQRFAALRIAVFYKMDIKMNIVMKQEMLTIYESLQNV